MNWLEAFFAWLLRLPRTARLAAMARTYIEGVLHDLDTHAEGSLDPATEHSFRRNCGALLFTAHTLVAAFIVCRARELAGLKVTRPHMDFHATPRRLASRETLRKRAEELLRRLDRAEAHARKLAETLTTSEMNDPLGALSSASPAEAGAQTHLGLVQSTQLSSLQKPIERFARIFSGAGPRPPPGCALWVSRPETDPAPAA